MRYYIDTEFMEDGITIDLLSIGLVCEDGREFYGINRDADHSKANEFVRDTVIPHLMDDVRSPAGTMVKTGEVSIHLSHNYRFYHAPRQIIRTMLMDFVRPEEKRPEFWGYYADYDWVVFCQLFGRMIDLPKHFPMYCNDIKQLCKSIGDPKLPKQDGTTHHALLDARHNQMMHRFLEVKRAYPDAYCCKLDDGTGYIVWPGKIQPRGFEKPAIGIGITEHEAWASVKI